MSYTNVANVAGMYPTFKRGAATQQPPDSLIQTFIDDVAAEINVILKRRFNETIQAPPALGNFSSWIAGLSQDGVNVLEIINRYGAAAQLGETLATFGVASARENSKQFRDEYESRLNQLDKRGKDGKPLASGRYDHEFDSLAQTETPRPVMTGSIPGGDQSKDQTPATAGQTNVFGKFDKRGT